MLGDVADLLGDDAQALGEVLLARADVDPDLAGVDVPLSEQLCACLLYTSDAADEL